MIKRSNWNVQFTKQVPSRINITKQGKNFKKHAYTTE